MVTVSEEVVGLIPARGGSRSIPRKNTLLLGGHPLVRYVIEAGKAAHGLSRIFCSTDDDNIGRIAASFGAIFIRRPIELAADNSPVVNTAHHLLTHLDKTEGSIPWAVALLQPTSPFLLPEHIDDAICRLQEDSRSQSVQTVCEIAHNFQAYNQRVISGSYVDFAFKKERKRLFCKQMKPKFHIFGNLVITKSQAVLEKTDLFAPPSLASIIDPLFAVDVDTLSDVPTAERLIAEGNLLFVKSWRG